MSSQSEHHSGIPLLFLVSLSLSLIHIKSVLRSVRLPCPSRRELKGKHCTMFHFVLLSFLYFLPRRPSKLPGCLWSVSLVRIIIPGMRGYLGTQYPLLLDDNLECTRTTSLHFLFRSQPKVIPIPTPHPNYPSLHLALFLLQCPHLSSLSFQTTDVIPEVLYPPTFLLTGEPSGRREEKANKRKVGAIFRL